jgi:hypothetical protein
VSTSPAFRPKLEFTPRKGGGYVVASRRGCRAAILTLMALLAASPRTEMPPPYLPGNSKRTGSSEKCACGGVFVNDKNGIHCQDCGDPPPEAK